MSYDLFIRHCEVLNNIVGYVSVAPIREAIDGS